MCAARRIVVSYRPYRAPARPAPALALLRCGVTTQPINAFYREYALSPDRAASPGRAPGAHQAQALQALHDHFVRRARPFDGGLLVLPTGGGKTFTALRFLCRGPLSQGSKVLWLAHTHHLLEQAFASLAGEVGQIGEPRRALRVRVVSGTPGHSGVADIKPQDDVLIATLQTVTRAYAVDHPALRAWLAGAGEQLVVVFDEAHHAPAHSYRTLLLRLRERQAGLYLLGLTATPATGDDGRGGWFRRLFPGGILYQTTAQTLMAAGVLARPVFEEHATNVAVAFDEREYRQWLGSYRDLPEEIIEQLARNRERNELIAGTYLQHRERYGKTLIFVDRWYQCEMLCEMLIARGVRAGAVYSHVTYVSGGPEARNQRTRDDNHEVLDRFRRGELDVLINVRMLTEGTDVPDVETVFLTRQTTSHVLLTQMIGRALRGQRFGGTAQAYVVAFVDSWRHLISWAEYQLTDGDVVDEVPVPVRRVPLHLVSIALVRDLARRMDQGLLVGDGPFRALLPVGWYRADYLARVEGGDDLEPVVQLVMVFEHEQGAYTQLLAALAGEDLGAFGDEELQLAEQRAALESWRAAHFAEVDVSLSEDLLLNLFHLARHLAFHEGAAPPFLVFAERDSHDLDQVARAMVEGALPPREKLAALEAEYRRPDRYWSALYPSFLFFKSQYDACENRLLLGDQPAAPVPFASPELLRPREPSQEVKDQVLRRDEYRCRSCGETTRRLLQIDHVAPHYLGGVNSPANLQVLCETCNQHKGISEINFRHHETALTQPPAQFPALEAPPAWRAGDSQAWAQFLCRAINFFYRCAAVEEVRVVDGPDASWHVRLWAGNDPQWLAPFLDTLVQQVQARRFEGGAQRIGGIAVSAPDLPAVTVTLPPPGPGPQPPAAAQLALATARGQLVLTSADVPLGGRGQRPQALPGLPRGATVVAAVAHAGEQLVALSDAGKAYALPGLSTDAPTALADVASLSSRERVCGLIAASPSLQGFWVVLSSEGQVKRLSAEALLAGTARGRTVLGAGAIAGVAAAEPGDEMVIVSAAGYAIRFPAADVPEQGGAAAGVRGMRLGEGDRAIGLAIARTGAVVDLVVITEDGQAKRTPLAEYRAQRRDGSGVATSSVSGLAVALLAPANADLMVVTAQGRALRVRLADIPRQGRVTAGPQLIRLEAGDRPVAAIVLPAEE